MKKEKVLKRIKFETNLEIFTQETKISATEKLPKRAKEMFKESSSLARPKAMWVECNIKARGGNWIKVSDQTLKSKVLSETLDKGTKVLYPYIATSGKELYDWSTQFKKETDKYWAHVIQSVALKVAVEALKNDLLRNINFPKIANMSPGRIEDWPIEEQSKLFDIFGKAYRKIGVVLTEDNLMIPTKSVSGVMFPTEVNFDSCKLCTRENCPWRNAAYDSALQEKIYK